MPHGSGQRYPRQALKTQSGIKVIGVPKPRRSRPCPTPEPLFLPRDLLRTPGARWPPPSVHLRHSLQQRPQHPAANPNDVADTGTATGLPHLFRRTGFLSPSQRMHYPLCFCLKRETAIALQLHINTGDEALQTFLNLSSPYLLLCCHTSMEILENGIQDDSSIVFAHDKGTSVLFKVLSAFVFRNISLTEIESQSRNRSIKLVSDLNEGTASHFEYLFYVDFET
ncbi:hypothetical protein TB1_026565 [Malus domestica]